MRRPVTAQCSSHSAWFYFIILLLLAFVKSFLVRMIFKGPYSLAQSCIMRSFFCFFNLCRISRFVNEIHGCTTGSENEERLWFSFKDHTESPQVTSYVWLGSDETAGLWQAAHIFSTREMLACVFSQSYFVLFSFSHPAGRSPLCTSHVFKPFPSTGRWMWW